LLVLERGILPHKLDLDIAREPRNVACAEPRKQRALPDAILAAKAVAPPALESQRRRTEQGFTSIRQDNPIAIDEGPRLCLASSGPHTTATFSARRRHIAADALERARNLRAQRCHGTVIERPLEQRAQRVLQLRCHGTDVHVAVRDILEQSRRARRRVVGHFVSDAVVPASRRAQGKRGLGSRAIRARVRGQQAAAIPANRTRRARSSAEHCHDHCSANPPAQGGEDRLRSRHDGHLQMFRSVIAHRLFSSSTLPTHSLLFCFFVH
jgi:hypothetical protein